MEASQRARTAANEPERLGDYDIVAPLSAGGMGVIYRGRPRAGGPDVALKTVHLESESLLSGMRREIRSLKGLAHPGVVRILDEGTDRGVPFYAMELLEGPTLRQFHNARAITRSTHGDDAAPSSGTFGPAMEERGAPLPPSADRASLTRALSIVRTISHTLAFVHGRGIVHRDLKPDNVILTEDRGPVIVDFGLAVRALGQSGREELEAAGRIMGSPGYMAPEQVRGDLVDARADLYALGCMLFEIATGRLPFEGSAVKLLFSKKLFAEPPSTRAFSPDTPLDLDRLVMRLLSRRVEDRPGHADDVARTLAALGAERLGPAGPPPEPYLYRPALVGRDDVTKLAVAAMAVATATKAALEPSDQPDDGAPSTWVDVRAENAPPSDVRVIREPHGTGPATQLDLTLDVVAGAAASSAAGDLLFVSGESGAGKTRLAMELSTEAVRRGFAVVSCQGICVDTEGPEQGVRAGPLHLFRDFFTTLSDRIRARGEAGYEQLLGERGAVLAAYHPDLAELPGHVAIEPPDLPPEAARERVHEALRETLSAFAQEQPLFLVLDDVQWADEHTLGFLCSLRREWFAKSPLLILVLFRREEQTPTLSALVSAWDRPAIELPKLREDSLIRIVQGMLAVPLPDPRLVAFLCEHGGGNPFFIAEYLRAAISERVLVRDADGNWSCGPEADGPLGALPLPHSLSALIELRLRGLSHEARRIVDALAVLGRETVGAVLDHTVGAAQLLASEPMGELVLRSVVEEHEPGVIRFVHDKIREAIYARLTDAARRELHLRAGAALLSWAERGSGTSQIASELAHHFAEGGDADRACQFFELAGERSFADGSFVDASRSFEAAAALWTNAGGARGNVRRAGWVRKAAAALHATGNLRGAERRGREALELLTGGPTLLDQDPPGRLFDRARYASRAMTHVATQLLGLLKSERTTAPAGDREAHREAALAAEKLAESYLFLNDQTRAALATVLAGNHAQRLGPSAELARAYSQLAIAASYIPLHPLGKVYAERAQSIARVVCDRRTDLVVEFMRGFWSAGLFDGRESRACLSTALALSRELSDRRREEECLALLGMVEAIHGLHGDSLDRYGELERLALRSQNEQARFWAYTGRAQVWVRLGRVNATIDDYERLQPYVERTGDTAERIQLVVPGPLYVKKGLRDRARATLADFLRLTVDRAPAGCMLFWSYAAACDTAFALLEDAAPRERAQLEHEAEQTVRVMEQFANIFPLGRSEAQRARGRWLARAGNTRKARRLLHAALDSAHALDLPIEGAKAHLDLAKLSESATERERHRSAARDVCARVGSWGLLDEVER